MKTAQNLGDHVKKAMVWEIWDRVERRIIWFCREVSGMVLRIDPDSYQLQGFFRSRCRCWRSPPPTAASRAPSTISTPLAADLDETSARISDLTKQIKVRGGYNGASPEIADILTAADGKMIPVDGVDMINGGLQNHIWMLPIDPACRPSTSCTWPASR